MKLIIAGCRDIVGRAAAEAVRAAVDAAKVDVAKVDEVVSGGAHGIDHAGEAWAAAHRLPVKKIMAEWAQYGRAAGPRRNRAMAEYARPDGVLVAVWDGRSRGTANAIDAARLAGLRVHVHLVKRETGRPVA